MSSWWRDVLRRFHPEGIPWPGSVLYNTISQSEMFRRHYKLVAEHVTRYCRAGRILDIGTGPGWLLLALGQLLLELELVGVDISPAMIATARQNMKREGCGMAIELKVAGAETLPFPENAFDAVVSTGSLHHWKDPITALNEVHRVLKIGGYALVYDLVRRLPPTVAGAARREFGSLSMHILWLHSFEEPFYSPQDMMGLIPATPFREAEAQFVGVLCCLVLRKTTGSDGCCQTEKH
jgi:ubiquinone/menaquinone biosynthesis C-methylase UbiE